MTTVRLVVYGRPAPQGSKKASINPRTGKVWMREQTAEQTDAWRAAVSAAAMHERIRTGIRFCGPVTMSAVFRFPMPRSRPSAVRKRGWGPKYTAPDRDKLLRSTGDALKDGGLIADDALIWAGPTHKIELVDGWLGAEIVLSDDIPDTCPTLDTPADLFAT